ncbi:hypothetical protein QR680_012982 [Steinernema hermaphroditum]|uniref:Thyroid transcription factor 1-associated protein 26 n=1 Tax=Steinernema hermaphroditum TaxID=289476 RepID=A0AA39M1H8_9BILA|nr:hypothetical protein QR680_012982 [Steinernema hermaphroditum]
MKPSNSRPSNHSRAGGVKNKPKMKKDTAYKRAQAAYHRIQEERRKEAEDRQKKKEEREKAIEGYMSIKKKMNKALKKRTKKGQPKLNAQVEVLLEKIEKRVVKK